MNVVSKTAGQNEKHLVSGEIFKRSLSWVCFNLAVVGTKRKRKAE